MKKYIILIMNVLLKVVIQLPFSILKKVGLVKLMMKDLKELKMGLFEGLKSGLKFSILVKVFSIMMPGMLVKLLKINDLMLKADSLYLPVRAFNKNLWGSII